MWFGDSVAPVLVERPVAQRGPRELVRVPLRRGEGLPRGRHRVLSRPHRLRRLRRPDEGRLRARRRVARRVRARSRCPPARTRCSTSSATTAARSCSTRCARRSATRRSSASSAPTSDRFRDRSVTHRRLHRARRPGLRPPGRRAVPARLGLRHQDAADAGPPGLDRQPGRAAKAPSRSPRPRPARRSAADRARCRRPRWAAAPHRDGPGRALASVLSVRQVKRTRVSASRSSRSARPCGARTRCSAAGSRSSCPRWRSCSGSTCCSCCSRCR